jgi:hypothetical protein
LSPTRSRISTFVPAGNPPRRQKLPFAMMVYLPFAAGTGRKLSETSFALTG